MLNLKLADSSEKMTAGWVDMACTFANRMWNIPKVQKLLCEADDLPPNTNPLEGTSKLQQIVSKARTPERITMFVESLLDLRKAGFITDTPKLSMYQGSQPGAGGKGIVDLICFKWDVGKHIIENFCSQVMSAELAAETKQVLSSPSAYRAKCGFPDEERDLTWRSSWPAAAEECFQWLEGTRHLQKHKTGSTSFNSESHFIIA